eukprot:scaffold258192_cov22-Prasinocladus_malaysianus.AAC.1
MSAVSSHQASWMVQPGNLNGQGMATTMPSQQPAVKPHQNFTTNADSVLHTASAGQTHKGTHSLNPHPASVEGGKDHLAG